MPYKELPALYSTWLSMRRRCNNKNDAHYHNYGGRGITVCERWQNSYQAFAEDMGERPAGFSLERIDNEKGYFPGNCKWACRKEQQRNQRRTIKIIIDGVEYLAIDLAEKSGVKVDTIVRRAKLGYSYNAVIAKPTETYVDGFPIGRAASVCAKKSKTHCARGHEYTDNSFRLDAKGNRVCKICHALRARERYAKKRVISETSTYTE